MFVKGGTGLEEGLQVSPMCVGAAWEVLNRERIAGVYAVSERRSTNGIDSTHLSKKSGIITLTSSWDDIISAPWMVWGQKPKMSKTPENHSKQFCRNGKRYVAEGFRELVVRLL